ncbi:MAG: hypothetical protein ACI9GZ_003177 [Bacteroidia bacterium]|jgi:hypothetical protein
MKIDSVIDESIHVSFIPNQIPLHGGVRGGFIDKMKAFIKFY